MAKAKVWAEDAAKEILFALQKDYTWISEDVESKFADIIQKHCPFKPDILYVEAKDPPLLQCVFCHNTESCAGAMARVWNHGRCMHCGGAFKVVRD